MDKTENKIEHLKIALIKDPFPHAIIDNFYTEDELKLIWHELDFYTSPHKFWDATQTGGAIDKLTRMPLPKHYAIELDILYQSRRNVSDILTLNRKFFNADIVNAISELHPFMKGLKQVNKDNTKIKYYEDGEYYKSHQDLARFTSVTYLFKEPKSFTGGDLFFEEYNYTIPIENNRLVFFTGCLLHASTDLKMNNEKKHQKCSGFGKYTISNFMNVIG